MESYLLSCDWGTSSFRLVLYDINGQNVVGEIQSADGISVVHGSWQHANDTAQAISKADFFGAHLSRQIATLAKRIGRGLDQVPVLISGMASSSIGMAEIPYAHLPFPLDGSAVNVRVFATGENFSNDIILISGVQSDRDVMRGEETQLIGIWASLLKKAHNPKEAIFIFPGTHSKHIQVNEGLMTAIRTFMTGEMYQVIAHHTILKDSLTISGEDTSPEASFHAFKKGVRSSGEAPILNSLFTVRTNQLFNRLSKSENAYYLSGLLIGNELIQLLQQPGLHFYLCSGQKLYKFYRLAIEELGLINRTTFISPAEVDRAAMVGHKIIFEQYLSKRVTTA